MECAKHFEGLDYYKPLQGCSWSHRDDSYHRLRIKLDPDWIREIGQELKASQGTKVLNGSDVVEVLDLEEKMDELTTGFIRSLSTGDEARCRLTLEKYLSFALACNAPPEILVDSVERVTETLPRAADFLVELLRLSISACDSNWGDDKEFEEHRHRLIRLLEAQTRNLPVASAGLPCMLSGFGGPKRGKSGFRIF